MGKLDAIYGLPDTISHGALRIIGKMGRIDHGTDIVKTPADGFQGLTNLTVIPATDEGHSEDIGAEHGIRRQIVAYITDEFLNDLMTLLAFLQVDHIVLVQGGFGEAYIIKLDLIKPELNRFLGDA